MHRRSSGTRQSESIARSWASVLEAPLLSCLCAGALGWRSSLPTALLLLDDRHRRRDELNPTVAAVGPCVKLAVVVEVVLAIELVLATELAREPIGSLAVEAR